MDPKAKISSWLEKLEQESWQLELLVSGFTIFLLLSAYGAINSYQEGFAFHHEGEGVFYRNAVLLLYVFSTCILVLIVNLILHLAFRGFWIGAIGLRSVGASTDFDRLHYSEFFTEKLKDKVASMDTLIINLDKVCSMVFSFTFLIIFLFISLFLFLLLFTSYQLILQFIANYSPSWLGVVLKYFSFVTSLIFIVAGLVYLIDSLSLGLVKKSKRLRPVYYPMYVLMSTITLSFLYRTIYYNIITKFPLVYTRLVLIGYLLIIVLIPFFALDDYRYFPDNETTNSLSSQYYDDLREEGVFIRKACIPSMTLSDPYLKLFVRYNPRDNPALKKHCPGFEPAKQGRFKHGVSFTKDGLILSTPKVEETHPVELMNCLQSFYQLKIDNRPVDARQVMFYTHPNREEKGIMMLIDAQNLDKGLHFIHLAKQSLTENELQVEDFASIQFWKQ
jgi:hypothetical protein